MQQNEMCPKLGRISKRRQAILSRAQRFLYQSIQLLKPRNGDNSGLTPFLDIYLAYVQFAVLHLQHHIGGFRHRRGVGDDDSVDHLITVFQKHTVAESYP